MKTYIDNKLLDKAISSPSILPKDLFITLTWPSFLSYIGLGSLLETFPKFSTENPLFTHLTSAMDLPEELVVRLYDQIFVECLTYVKALPEIKANFLLYRLQKTEKPLFLSASLEMYEKKMRENPSETMHDLILYLAFDRVCVWISQLFEHPSSPTVKMEILKKCLLESFSHIKQDGKTSPGFFRLIEALYAYQMREENLQTYPEEEWIILCESSKALKAREDFIDLFYIEEALERKEVQRAHFQMFTQDSPEIVQARLALTSYLIDKIKLEDPGWSYRLHPFHIHHL